MSLVTITTKRSMRHGVTRSYSLAKEQLTLSFSDNQFHIHWFDKRHDQLVTTSGNTQSLKNLHTLFQYFADKNMPPKKLQKQFGFYHYGREHNFFQVNLDKNKQGPPSIFEKNTCVVYSKIPIWETLVNEIPKIRMGHELEDWAILNGLTYEEFLQAKPWSQTFQEIMRTPRS